MAVATTGAIYKSLSFDGVESRNFGVYITGEAVYNAPQRDVEMISIPGRSGTFALDKGRFENIEVTYPAGIFADNEADFAQAVSDFRNYLCSRNGYCRLVDEYNPEEYRMAIYKSGLDVSPAQLKAGEFDITFDCKPQRWLTSGEAAVEVSDGDTLTNPTLFESSPLLEMEGSGSVSFNGYSIDIGVPVIGNVPLSYIKQTLSYFLRDVSALNAGDAITVSGLKISITNEYDNSRTLYQVTDAQCTGWSGCYLSGETYGEGGTKLQLRTFFPDFSFRYGTAWTKTVTSQCSVHYYSPFSQFTAGVSITVSYDGSRTITISYTAADGQDAPQPTSRRPSINLPKITGYSTKEYDAGVIYCDCEIGEFYRIADGEVISMNHIGDLGSDLPKLASGVNTITYDNTITSLKIHPRWWKV